MPREDRYDVPGYGELLRTAVERISWVLELTTEEAAQRLTQRGDRFELRIVDQSTAGGRLPIVRAPDVVNGFLLVIRGGARAEFRGARPSYAGADPAEVSEALDGIELLAPAAGSFRLLAVSSVEAQLPLDREHAVPDKSRRAVAAAIRGLHAAAETTSHEIPDEIDQLLPAIDSGVSTTLLSGLEGISSGTPGMSVKFTAIWDPGLPEVEAPAGGILLTPPQLHRLPRLVEQLQHHEPHENQVVNGWVKTVSADELAEAGRPAGFVICEAKFEGRRRDIRIELPPGDFSEYDPASHCCGQQAHLSASPVDGT